MLNRLKLENFKAWREADLTFGKVTGLFGTNSAGKSSLLHLLLLLKQTRNATDRSVVLDFGGPAGMVNLGTFEDVVHQHDKTKAISWHIDWTPPSRSRSRDPWQPSANPLLAGPNLQIRYAVGLRNKRPWPRELAYRLADAEFRMQPKTTSRQEFRLATDHPGFSFVRNPGRAWPLPQPAKAYLFPSQARSYFQNADFLGDFELAYETLMDSIYYLGPLREYPRREYHWAGSSPEDVGQRGERTVDAILAASISGETWSLGYRRRRKSFQEIIAHWLYELGLIYDFRVEEIAKGTNLYRAMVELSATGVTTPLTDVGFGVSQVLPVLVLLYYVPEGSTVLMEQPEIHLHPAVQSAPGGRDAKRSRREKRTDCRRESQRTLDATPATTRGRGASIFRRREVVLCVGASRQGRAFRSQPERMGRDRELAREFLRRRNGRDRGDLGSRPEEEDGAIRMTVFVVDTNVAIAANGRRTHADLRCQRSCIATLKTVVKEETIAIDDAGLIFQEYAKHLRRSGQPGVGDLFLKHVFDHQYRLGRVRRVALRRSTDTRRGFRRAPREHLRSFGIASSWPWLSSRGPSS